ncbi:BaiN/RdsA family NAD(P)/FAD-dependent oxidoreductase [Almyronema epifaneia]|uniref:NAD(P)/FAD-dependent oxidoreductase n=1 Tax=Almyronema epifaneia S1 TaxID=2991925 RepID=A0ABW6IHY4_9CYAN
MGEYLKIGVIGGGAAGFFGAIACAKANSQARVVLFEGGRSPLAKVRISGGGRCNVTHHCFDPALLVQHYPRGSKALRGAFSRFQPKDTITWFAQQGVPLKTEADGRMFPVTDDSETIVNCLWEAALNAGVELKTQTTVKAVNRQGEQLALQLKSETSFCCDRLLLATGSSPQGIRLAQSLGHTVAPPVPSLFTFNIAEAQLRSLAGIAVEPVALKLTVAGTKPLTQTGPLLITHWGVSGPAVLKLSAWGARALHEAQYQAELQVNWLPQFTAEQVRQQLTAAKAKSPKRAIANYDPFSLPRRLWQYLVHRAEIAAETTWAGLSKKAINQLVSELTQGHYAISGKGVFKDEFVTCGGVHLKEVDFKTMASRRCPGLYFAGEILDIDGITGGFNFQSAWTTGWLAGQAMAH